MDFCVHTAGSSSASDIAVHTTARLFDFRALEVLKVGEIYVFNTFFEKNLNSANFHEHHKRVGFSAVDRRGRRPTTAALPAIPAVPVAAAGRPAAGGDAQGTLAESEVQGVLSKAA